MKKQIFIFAVVFVLLTLGLSGCNKQSATQKSQEPSDEINPINESSVKT